MPGFAKQRSPLLFGQGLLARHSCRLAGEVYLSPSPNRWRRFQTVFGERKSAYFYRTISVGTCSAYSRVKRWSSGLVWLPWENGV
jgi:hypothetical protein